MPSLLLASGCLAMLVCQYLVFYYAPVEANMGLIQKIFYIHLPLAWWAMISFFTVFCASLAYIFKRSAALDSLGRAATEIGLLFGSTALITGMIWARRSWGVWWTWDPRLTTTLVMCFIYSACLIFRTIDLPPKKLKMICAILGTLAFLDVPLVFFSARLFRSIHPAVFASRSGGLEPEMKITVLACACALGLFWTGLLFFRTRQLALRESLTAISESRAGADF